MQEYICANALAKLCQFDGKVVPPRWHKTQLAYGGHLHRTLSRKLLHLFAKESVFIQKQICKTYYSSLKLSEYLYYEYK